VLVASRQLSIAAGNQPVDGLISESEWAFFMSEMRRNNRGFVICECVPPTSILKCKYDCGYENLQAVLTEALQLEKAFDIKPVSVASYNDIASRSTLAIAKLTSKGRESLAGQPLDTVTRGPECAVRFIRAKAYEGNHVQSIYHCIMTLS